MSENDQPATKPHQEPDASDTFEEQVQNVPVENIKAPVKRAPTKPKIPEKDAAEAQKVKDDLVSEERNNHGNRK